MLYLLQFLPCLMGFQQMDLAPFEIRFYDLMNKCIRWKDILMIYEGLLEQRICYVNCISKSINFQNYTNNIWLGF